mmetsp:Transcript_33691/g.64473  ORF Transcript_33691/g.64473 Transcript_33691/m.64473 type:complete len:498 (-) Transcript_33691:447-1940(-)|eukprot:CAMPEP_0114294650 /NCGR_PEP_ID=MMETSP0059-20121206/10246_1 /TAXON_ID=36894 /ORGANISM="Pyramimonas parkeae, Strain CCMP726" /LENGTH=497 /DNA_ID=CAMNT_0001416455 /DNA_START=203 /DNA_END=1696 /DNA_ORIENTATION=+
MPAKTAAQQAAARLKLALQNKLETAKVDEALKNSLFKAILIVERFIKYAKGSEAEFGILKEQVEVIIKNSGRDTQRQPQSARRHQQGGALHLGSAPNPSMGRKLSATPSAKSSTPPPQPLVRSASLAEEGASLDFTLPPLLVEKRARAAKGDYDRLRLAHDELARQQIQGEKDKYRSMQAQLRQNLNEQMNEHEEQRREEMRQKLRVKEEMHQQMEQYENDLHNQHLSNLERAVTSKKDRHRQVMEARAKAKAERDYNDEQDKRIRDKAAADVRAHEEYLRKKAVEDDIFLKKVMKENQAKLDHRMMEREKEKEYEVHIAMEGIRIADERERQRLAALEKIAEKSRMALKMGGMDELVAAREQKNRDEQMRTAKAQEARRIEQDRLEAEKVAKKKKQEEDTLHVLGVQVEEHRVKKERELREKHELKLKLAQDHEFYRVVEKEHADLRRFMVVQNKRELKDQWKENQSRRFLESTEPMNDFEEARNRQYFVDASADK